jgi:hypothetical protein
MYVIRTLLLLGSEGFPPPEPLKLFGLQVDNRESKKSSHVTKPKKSHDLM